MTTLAEEYPKQQQRCRELLEQYRKIGPAGEFARVMLTELLEAAEKAVDTGDTVEMLKCYQEMKGYK